MDQTITRRAALTTGTLTALGIGLMAVAAVLPTPTRAAAPPAVAVGAAAGTMRAAVVRAQACPDNLVALFLVHNGRLAVFANTRLIEESAAVAWAERTASAGRVYADVWWDDDVA